MATLLTHEIRSLRDTQRELEQLVATDRLTGVGNRRHFEQQAEAECARARRYGIPVTLILFDVDDFKRINDAFGHQVGDSVLITLTRRVASRLRDTDAIARWGGEEFAIVAPCTTSSGAEVLADKIRAAVAGEDFDVVGRVTISLGIAQLFPDESTPGWIGRADDRLYEAKRAGRNRVVSSVQPEQAAECSMLVWGEQFLVHHPVVDAQHAEIFRLTNEILLDPPDRPLEASLRRFDALLDNVAKHFLSEERVLLEHGCEAQALALHAEMHHGLLAQATDLRQRLSQRTALVSEVGDFMIRRIAVGHVLDVDLPLFASLTTSMTVPVQEGSRPSLRLRLRSALSKR
jgi:diguanylate cyclase (GGDEF)-like protein/hemerythrin-like metal-binding protein